MPITNKTYGNMEIIQGSDFEITITMDDTHVWNDKVYRVTIVKDFSNTAFNGSTETGKLAFGDAYVPVSSSGGTPVNVNTLGIGKITIAPSNTLPLSAPYTRTGGTITIGIDQAKTAALDDDFEGYWDLLERTPKDLVDSALTTAHEFTRQGQGEVYVNAGATVPGDFD